MEIFKIILLILAGIAFVMIFYCGYQLIRSGAVFKIRVNWIKTSDPRYSKYEYYEMAYPHRSNMYGLRYPKDSHYK